MKIILIISAPRSGTNFFCDFFGEAFLNVCSCYEIFCNNAGKKISYTNVQTVKFLANEYNFDTELPYDTLLMKVSDELNKLSKLEIIKKISKVPGYDFVSFKIFENQVSVKELNGIINIVDFCITIKRNDIHRYISFEKSLLSNKWANYDYSNLKIFFSINKYSSKKKKIVSFFKTASDICKKLNKKNLILNYETFCELNTQQKCDFLYQKIFQENFCDILMNRQSVANIKTHFQKQNNQNDLSMVIENYNEVKNFIDSELNTYII